MVKVWDVISGQEVLALRDHESYVTCVAWSPDGKKLASSSNDDTIRVWDATRGFEVSAAELGAGTPTSLAGQETVPATMGTSAKPNEPFQPAVTTELASPQRFEVQHESMPKSATDQS